MYQLCTQRQVFSGPWSHCVIIKTILCTNVCNKVVVSVREETKTKLMWAHLYKQLTTCTGSNVTYLHVHYSLLSNIFSQDRPNTIVYHRLLDSLVVECWLRVRDVPGSIPSQGPRHTKDVIKMVQVVPLFSTEHSKGKILALSQK